MKIDDGPLNRYLIKNLQPLTEADPSLLANYVAALLKNNKPKKELQKLCIDQLYDFLGDGTKSFVAKLFESIEDGTVPLSAEEMETSKAIESGVAIPSGIDVVELRTSPPHLERLLSTAVQSFSEGEDESSDDDDDDRNHKHRRRVSRSRSFDRGGEVEADRGLHRKQGWAIDYRPLLQENDRQLYERRGSGHTLHTQRDGVGNVDRRLGHEHGSSRFSAEGGQRGIRSGPQFREGPGPCFDGPNGMIRGNIGQGRGVGSAWTPHDQRFPPLPFSDGPEFAPPLPSPGLGASFLPGRGMPGHSVSHTPWPGYGSLPGLGNGRIEHSRPLRGEMLGDRGAPSISTSMGMSMNISMGRPRCLDFEERGYCLRGDLCPMEHGANRIVVEDVQSLSKFNLPVSLPSGRGLGIGPASGPSSSPIPPIVLGTVNRSNHGSREATLPATGDDPALVNGIIPDSAGVEPDSYDPDQPLWNKDHPEASSGLGTLSSLQKGSHDQEWEGDSLDKCENREESEGMETGRLVRLGVNTNSGSQISEGGASVWDRIGPFVSVASRLDAGLRTATSVDLLQSRKQLRKESGDEPGRRLRGVWQGKWNREVESEDESASKGFLSTCLKHSHGQDSGHGDAGTGQKSVEGTSYASQGTGGHSSSVVGTERAQRTLYVSFIPSNSNRSEQLLAHFQKFGDVLDIRIPAHSDRAFVQFSQREDAESALTAPDAVMGNRFIRLSWANRDSIADAVDGAASTAGSHVVKSSCGIYTGSLVQISKVFENVAMNGSSQTQVDLAPVKMTGKSLSSNCLSFTPATMWGAVKKQEELERMREEIRKKQETLAQKRNDFRRKLDQLAKQGPVQGETVESEQSSKRQRVDDAKEIAITPQKILVSEPNPSSSATATLMEPSSAALLKKISEDVLNKHTFASVMVQPPQPSPRGGRLSHARINNANIAYVPPMTWGPARFKLDNRTTVFRVLPPFPADVDVGMLKDHFVTFGDLGAVEVDDVEGPKVEVSTKLSENSSVRVSFASRRAAERAFVQGRWLHGQNLQLVWVNSPSTIAGGRGTTATTQADFLGKKSSIVTPEHLMELPSNVKQEGINGKRSPDQVITGHRQVTGMDENILDEYAQLIGTTHKKLSSTTKNLDWRRDTGLQGHGLSKSGPKNVISSLPTVSVVESKLASESMGISSLSS